MRNVVEAAPRNVSAHGAADDVELVPELQRVGELLDVRGVALEAPLRVGVAVAVPGSVEEHRVYPQLLHKLLRSQQTNQVIDRGWRFANDDSINSRLRTPRHDARFKFTIEQDFVNTWDTGKPVSLVDAKPWMNMTLYLAFSLCTPASM